jgi:hypothetical protein
LSLKAKDLRYEVLVSTNIWCHSQVFRAVHKFFVPFTNI